MARDHSRTYQQRTELARSLGYRSLWHMRQARAEGRITEADRAHLQRFGRGAGERRRIDVGGGRRILRAPRSPVTGRALNVGAVMRGLNAADPAATVSMTVVMRGRTGPVRTTITRPAAVFQTPPGTSVADFRALVLDLTVGKSPRWESFDPDEDLAELSVYIEPPGAADPFAELDESA